MENFDSGFDRNHQQKFWIEEFPRNTVRVMVVNSKPGDNVWKAQWKFYRKVRDSEDLKHLLSINIEGLIYTRYRVGETFAESRLAILKDFWRRSHPKEVRDRR